MKPVVMQGGDKPTPLQFGFNVPFHEAIAAMTARGVVLPDVYYGVLQGIARQKAFSIAGITALDQLTAVSDSLKKYMAEGGSFNNWQKEQAVVDLGLSKARLDNIWRTNLQGQYMAGKWEQFNRNAKTSPFLMYDAINDSRVRPSHLALDGIIRPVGDAFWATHSPPCGYRCRCSLISLSPKQAQDRSKDGKGLNQQPVLKDGSPALPDKGWDYDKTNRMAGIEKAIENKKTAAGSNWFKRTLLEQMEKKIVQNAKAIESSEKVATIEKSVEYKIAQELLNNLIDNAEKSTSENKLKQLWFNPEKYDPHIEKRVELGHISSKADYEARTFDVLANAKKIKVAIPPEGDMISSKFQLVADGWIVLVSLDGKIITSYEFMKDKSTFEQNETGRGHKIYEYSISTKDREILKRVFDLP